MADSTTGTVENLALVIANLSQSIEELKATIASQDTTIASLNGTIDSLKSDNEYLKNNNDLLREENAYLKRKLFGTRSEKMSYSQESSFLFLMKQKMNVNQSCLKIFHIPEPKRNKKVHSTLNWPILNMSKKFMISMQRKEYAMNVVLNCPMQVRNL